MQRPAFFCILGFLSLKLMALPLSSFSLKAQLISEVPDQEASSLYCAISWQAQPFRCVYQILQDEGQIVFCTDRLCLVFDAEKQAWIEQKESLEIIQQIAMDISNWFNADLGLGASGFESIKSYMEQGQLHSLWENRGKIPNPILRVESIYENGHFTSLRMLLADYSLFAHSLLTDYAYCQGRAYPQIIVTENYGEGRMILRKELRLSEVQLDYFEGLPEHIPLPELGPTTIVQKPQNREFSLPLPEKTSLHSSTASTDSNLALVILGAHSVYKRFISNQDMSNCPYTPSCSQYMLEAVKKNGPLGFVQGYERLKRCTAHEHGRNLYIKAANGKNFDPVP